MGLTVTNTYDEYKDRPELLKQKQRVDLIKATGRWVLIVYIVVSLGIISANAIISLSSRARLFDCTTAEGQCYKDGQARSGEIIILLLHQQAVALACAKQPGVITSDDIENCVQKENP